MQIVQSYEAAIGITINIQSIDNASMVNFLMVGSNKALINDGIGGGELGLSYQPSRQLNRFTAAAEGSGMNYSFGFDPAILADFVLSVLLPMLQLYSQ